MNFTLIGDEGKPWRRAIAIAAGVLLLLVALIFGRAETQLMSSAEVKTVQERGVLRIGVIPDMPGAELEKELGVKLFEKDSRHIKLTIYGEQFLPYAERILSMLDEGVNVLHQMAGSAQQIIRLGYFTQSPLL